MDRILYAGRAWRILLTCAKDQNTITYKDLGNRLSIHWRLCRLFLDPIQTFCLEENLPPLTALVVNKDTSTPGGGFIAWDITDHLTACQIVYDYNWDQVDNPFIFQGGQAIDDLVNRLIANPGDVSKIYSLVRSRGVQQSIFRKVLLAIHGNRCAMTGPSHEDLLEAAHILPWSECALEQRYDIRNGLLLSMLPHYLFDLDWLRINEDYKISAGPSMPATLTLSRLENFALNCCLNQKLILSSAERYWPDPTYIRARYAD